MAKSNNPFDHGTHLEASLDAGNTPRRAHTRKHDDVDHSAFAGLGATDDAPTLPEIAAERGTLPTVARLNDEPGNPDNDVLNNLHPDQRLRSQPDTLDLLNPNAEEPVSGKRTEHASEEGEHNTVQLTNPLPAEGNPDTRPSMPRVAHKKSIADSIIQAATLTKDGKPRATWELSTLIVANKVPPYTHGIDKKMDSTYQDGDPEGVSKRPLEEYKAIQPSIPTMHAKEVEVINVRMGVNETVTWTMKNPQTGKRESVRITAEEAMKALAERIDQSGTLKTVQAFSTSKHAVDSGTPESESAHTRIVDEESPRSNIIKTNKTVGIVIRARAGEAGKAEFEKLKAGLEAHPDHHISAIEQQLGLEPGKGSWTRKLADVHFKPGGTKER